MATSRKYSRSNSTTPRMRKSSPRNSIDSLSALELSSALSSYDIDQIFKKDDLDAQEYVALYRRLLYRIEKMHGINERTKGAIDIYELTDRIPDDFFINRPYFTYVVFEKAAILETNIVRYKRAEKMDADVADRAIKIIKRVRLKKLRPIINMPGVKAQLKQILKDMRKNLKKTKKMSSKRTISSSTKTTTTTASSNTISKMNTIHGAPIADICAYVANNRPCHLVKKLNKFQYTFNLDGKDYTAYIYSLDTLKEYIAFLVDLEHDDPLDLKPMMVCSMIANLSKTAKSELFRELSADLTERFKSVKDFQNYIDDDFWMADPGPAQLMQDIIHDMGRANFINFMYDAITTKGKNNMPFEMNQSRKKSLKNIRWADAGGNSP